MDNLGTAAQKLGEEVYKTTGATPGAGAGPGGPGGASPGPEASTDRGTTAGGAKKDEDVIDAEYEVKE